MRERNPETPRGREQPWLMRQFVRPVHPHIGEIVQVPQGVVIAGIIVLMLVSFVIIYGLAGRALGTTAVPKTVSPAGIVIPAKSATRSTTAPSPTITRATGASSGQTPTPAKAAPTAAQPIGATAAATPAAPPAAGTKYKVKAGDTLIAIAERHGVSVQAIITANNLKNDLIYVGQELVIPPQTPR